MDLPLSATAADEVGFHAEESVNFPAFSSPEKTEAIAPDEKDFALAQMAAGGNVAAFEMLYNRYHRRTYSLCLRMTSSVTEAEDLTQEVFIQLFRKIGSFRGDSAFTTWLHRMTVNQVLMHFRRRGVQSEKTTDDGEMPEQIVNGTENQNRMPILDRIALDKAIAQLPNGYRTVFVLHDVEGFEHEEIARMLKLSVGTSKSQLHKARLKLRGLLRKQNESAKQK
ncbi:MAG: RNA polymerase sigma factor [Pyrinomonadaceae bacterium]